MTNQEKRIYLERYKWTAIEVKKLKEQKEFFGVYVLQTNSSKSAQEVFESNKNVGGL